MSFPIKITLNNPPEGYAAEAEVVGINIPSTGDWYVNERGEAERADRDFENLVLSILRLTELEEGPNEIVRFFVWPSGATYGFDDLGGEWAYSETKNWHKSDVCEWSIEKHIQQGATEIFPQVAEPAQPPESPKVAALKKIVTEDPHMPQWIKDRMLAQIDVGRVESLWTAKCAADAIEVFCNLDETREGHGFWYRVLRACRGVMDYPPNPDEPAQPAESPKVAALKKIVHEDQRMPQWIKDRLLSQIDPEFVVAQMAVENGEIKRISEAVEMFCNWQCTKDGYGFWFSVEAASSGLADYPPNPDEPAPTRPEGWIWADGLAFAPIDWQIGKLPMLAGLNFVHAQTTSVYKLNGKWFRICGYSDEPNIREICMSPCTHRANRKYAVLKVEDGQC